MLTNLAPPVPVVRRVPERANLVAAARPCQGATLASSSTTSDNNTYASPVRPIGADFVDDPPALAPARRCRACGGPFQDPLPLRRARPWGLCPFCRRGGSLPTLGASGGSSPDDEAKDERQVRGADHARETGDRGDAARSGDGAPAAQERRCAGCRRSIAHRTRNARRCERCALAYQASQSRARKTNERGAR